MTLQFDKYSAHGNDFIVIDNRNHTIQNNNNKLFHTLCQRHTSIGADGVILIDTDKPDFSAHFFNADGLPALMCGNGARAAVDYARRLGIITTKGRFWVNGNVHDAEIRNNSSIGVEIHHKSLNITKHQLMFQGNEYDGFFCDTGVPHLVFINANITVEQILDFARMVRNAPEFAPVGVNVNFVHISDAHNISIKTYEKGVEDFTLSCGTGAAAAVCVGRNEALIHLPVNVHSEGGTLRVTEGNNPNSLWIWGTVEKVYSGIIDKLTIKNEK